MGKSFRPFEVDATTLGRETARIELYLMHDEYFRVGSLFVFCHAARLYVYVEIDGTTMLCYNNK